MKCYVHSAKCKCLFLTLFILFLIDSRNVVSKLELRKEKTSENFNKTKMEIFEQLERYENSHYQTKNSTLSTVSSNESKISLASSNKNYNAVLIAVIAVSSGFLMASIFLIFAMIYNKQTLSQISAASEQIVKSLNEIHKAKVSSGDVLTMHI